LSGSIDNQLISGTTLSIPYSPFSIPHSRLPIPDSLILDTGLKFLELLARWQPPEFHVSRARRFFGFFCDNLTWGNYLKNLLNREETLTGMEKVWREHFKE
jgi:hypothetical protein